jgi:hypothetical protein
MFLPMPNIGIGSDLELLMNQKSGSLEPLDSLDLVWGAQGIADLINVPLRQAYWLLETRKVPARKVGNLYVASREQLRKFFQNTAAEVTEEASHYPKPVRASHD